MKAPPKHPLQFLRWFCREDYLEEIEGDLTELYGERVNEIGKRKLSLSYNPEGV
jgi:putative ABC transport system permease protein